ncbi:MAG: hypothetical protein KJZ90_04585 [Rhodocyclaceae bacterium]|nr:hypothetical protein [Rhodocyclaceae bacterium]
MSALVDLDACRAIRRALIIGLSSFGEIERLDNAYSIHTGIAGERIPDDLRPLHPTGAPDTAAQFAEALAAVDLIESRICQADCLPPAGG